MHSALLDLEFLSKSSVTSFDFHQAPLTSLQYFLQFFPNTNQKNTSVAIQKSDENCISNPKQH